MMNEEEILKLAEKYGFTAAWTEPSDIPTDPGFLKYCAENRCGNYNANWSCPPDCGTPEEMRQKLLSAKKALVLESQYDIPGYNTPEVLQSKKAHRLAMLDMLKELRDSGTDAFGVSYGGCNLCTPCKKAAGEPCAHPELMMSCMSAYCVNVSALAEKCGLPFAWDEKKLYLFGMIMLK